MSVGFGVTIAMTVKCEQMICPYGYDAIFAGRLAFLMNMSGVFGIMIVSALLRWRNMPILYAKLLNVFIAIGMGIFCFVPITRGPFGTAFLVLSFVITGAAGIGVYPLSVQLLADVSFPNPESIGLTLAMISSQISMLFIAIVENYLNTELMEDLDVQVCWKEGAEFSLEPRDYKNYKMFLFFTTCAAVLPFTLFFQLKPDKRPADDQGKGVPRQQMPRRTSIVVV